MQLTTFVDISAIYALFDRDNSTHRAAAELFGFLAETDRLVAHSYILVETPALVQHWLGSAATRAFLNGLLPLLEVIRVGR